MTSSEPPVTREELEAILRRTVVSCFRNPAMRRLLQQAVAAGILKELSRAMWPSVGGLFFIVVVLIPMVSNWLGWGWVRQMLFGLALMLLGLYSVIRLSPKAAKEDEEWEERIEQWMNDTPLNRSESDRRKNPSFTRVSKERREF